VVIDGSTSLTESSAAPGKSCGSNCARENWTNALLRFDVRERNFPSFEILTNQGVEEMDVNIKDMLPNIFGQRTKKRKMKSMRPSSI